MRLTKHHTVYGLVGIFPLYEVSTYFRLYFFSARVFFEIGKCDYIFIEKSLCFNIWVVNCTFGGEF